MLAQLHSIIDRWEFEKYLFLPLYGNRENPLITAHAPHDRLVTVNGQLSFIFSGVYHFTERFKQKDSVLITSAITSVTVLSIPWNYEAALPQIVTYVVVEKRMENKRENKGKLW